LGITACRAGEIRGELSIIYLGEMDFLEFQHASFYDIFEIIEGFCIVF